MPTVRGYYYGFLLLHLAGYLVATHLYIRNLSVSGRQFKEWKNWVTVIQFGLEALVIAYFIVFGLYLFAGINTTLLRDGLLLIVTFFIHFVAYISIGKSTALNDPKRPNLDFDVSEKLKSKLDLILETEKPYLKQGIKLSDIAARLDTSPQRLSEFINVTYGVSFSELLNQYRIKEVKRLLTDNRYNVFDLDGIADQTGFNSRINLARVFKKLTGQSPSEYKKAKTNSNLKTA
jgi:AraC-like DNA-binding protein